MIKKNPWKLNMLQDVATTYEIRSVMGVGFRIEVPNKSDPFFLRGWGSIRRKAGVKANATVRAKPTEQTQEVAPTAAYFYDCLAMQSVTIHQFSRQGLRVFLKAW